VLPPLLDPPVVPAVAEVVLPPLPEEPWLPPDDEAELPPLELAAPVVAAPEAVPVDGPRPPPEVVLLEFPCEQPAIAMRPTATHCNRRMIAPRSQRSGSMPERARRFCAHGEPGRSTAGVCSRAMYSGHFAVGLALTERFPKVRPWILLVGVGLLDIIDGTLIAAGIERVSAAPREPLGFNLDFIDWDHSLLMALAWSAAFALLFFRRDRAAALPAGLAVFSHFLCDLPVHNGDLALWPGSRTHLGFYLWDRFPVGSWFLEGAFDLPLLAYFVVKAARRGAGTRDLVRVAVFLGLLHLSFSPWLSPMKWLARSVEQPLVSVLHGLLVVVGFSVPAVVLALWLGRGRAS
jgi:membrane-bound metal-dependent hydrolase YbcI (DUF457 family)